MVRVVDSLVSLSKQDSRIIVYISRRMPEVIFDYQSID